MRIVAVATIVENSGGSVREARVVMAASRRFPRERQKPKNFAWQKLDQATAKQAGEIGNTGN